MQIVGMTSDHHTFRIPESVGKTISLGGIDVVYKVQSEETRGSCAIVEHPVEAKRLVRPHVHKNEDEISYVVEGEIGVRIGDEEVIATKGDWVFKPRGIMHTFWNAGTTKVRLIEIITPGKFSQYFEELGEILNARGPPDLEKITELDQKYGTRYSMEWVPLLKEKYGLKLTGE
jgi:mannose-6-phosphate isomerase-like protein (cupin superfamily)